jgi:Domain of unknown function (DUF4105)
MWQVLLHYQPVLLRGGGFESEADGLGFFVAGVRGKRDPAAELDAMLTALFTAAPYASELEQPECKFPARTAWLRQQLALDEHTLPRAVCHLYDFWRTAIAPTAATLVYATAYLNSPASMYGHTFLRLSRSTGEGNPLLDYVVNFAADVDTTNGVVYAIKGVSGQFRGLFYLMPYYVKVQEYSNMESRDLWEFPLSLDKAQVERLVAHVWETRSTYFDYFFFSENCSYQLLTLLEVAQPNLRMAGRFQGKYVIPSDTVRSVLAEKGLVQGLTSRSAILTTMKRRRARLSGPQRELAERWAKLDVAAPPISLGGEDKPSQARILDAAYEYMRFREGLSKEPTPEFKRREQKLLLARGAVGEPSDTIASVPDVGAPQWGHATLRVALGAGVANQSGVFQALSLRFALHDFLDPVPGYPADSELEMGQLALRFEDDAHRLRLDRIDLIHIISAMPYDPWIRGVSWQVWLGADNARELGCDGPARDLSGWRCLYAGATTGGGFAARWGAQERLLTYALAGTDVGVGPAFSNAHAFRVGVGAEAGLVAEVVPTWRWEARARYFYYPLGARGGYVRASLTESLALTRRFSVRLGVGVAGDYAEATANLAGYF